MPWTFPVPLHRLQVLFPVPWHLLHLWSGMLGSWHGTWPRPLHLGQSLSYDIYVRFWLQKSTVYSSDFFFHQFLEVSVSLHFKISTLVILSFPHWLGLYCAKSWIAPSIHTNVIIRFFMNYYLWVISPHMRHNLLDLWSGLVYRHPWHLSLLN